jgi:hypothetical protein
MKSNHGFSVHLKICAFQLLIGDWIESKIRAKQEYGLFKRGIIGAACLFGQTLNARFFDAS